MASYLYNSLKRIVVGEEDDDPSCLKDPVTMALYEDPLKGLGLKQTAMPWDMRDALRTKYGLGAFLRRLRQPEDPEAQGLLQARRAACV